jgi:glycosyltransferase involved in cell wall biosynthesis
MINAFTPVYGIVTQPFISPDKTIYYCYDEISAAKWLKTHGAWAEKIFIKKADTVIVSSIPLFNSKKAYNSNIHLVKNGVDFQLFQRFIDIKRFEDTSEFIIGYVGSIDDRLDYDLLIMLIESLPGVRFRFMGRCLDERAKKIWKYENVEYLGTLKPVELAKEVNKIHLGLIPFVKNEFTTNIYPLKINEYLACGCAVVSTHFSDLSDFEKDIYISEKYSEFIELCKIALTENNMDKALKRVEVAKGNSWSSRAELFLSSIANSN